MTFSIKSSSTIGLYLLAIVSTVYLLMLGWNNALALDDYGYVSLVEKNGVWGMMRMAYQGWQCRFSTFLVNGLIFLLFGRAKNLIGVTLLMLFLGWGVMALLFSGINRKYDLGIPTRFLALISMITVNVGVVSFLEPATFFWLCALNYTISIWATLLLVYVLFFCDGSRVLRWALTIISSLYVSGTAENYTPLVILVLGLVWLIRLLLFKSNTRKGDVTNIMLFVSLIILGAGFLVMLSGPGNKNRLASLGEEAMAVSNLSFSGIVLKTIKGSAILLLREFSRIHFFLLVFPLFYGIGALYCKNQTSEITLIHCVFVIVLFALFVVTSVAGCVIGVGWYAPPRAFSFMSFVILGVIAYLGIRLGSRFHCKGRTLNSCMMLFPLVGTLFFVVMIARDKPLVEDYHHYVTSRNESIQKQKEEVGNGTKTNDPPFICHPFASEWRPNSYSSLRNMINICLGRSKRYYEPEMILMESTLSSDANDWRNRDLQYYYQAGFDIVCQDSNE